MCNHSEEKLDEYQESERSIDEIWEEMFYCATDTKKKPSKFSDCEYCMFDLQSSYIHVSQIHFDDSSSMSQETKRTRPLLCLPQTHIKC